MSDELASGPAGEPLREAPEPLVIPTAGSPPRVPQGKEVGVAKPLYAVWELTMKCDQPCEHCGSRAGAARASELSTEELFRVADELERLGTRELALIGGEAYLRPDLPKIVEYLAKKGMRVSMQTGGRAFHKERAKMLKDAGMYGIGVSVDGPMRIHDKLRGNLGSYNAAMKALDNAREVGMVVTSNAQINQLNYKHLWELVEALWKKDVIAWQVAFTVPMGRAADRPEWIIEPYMVPEVVDTLAAIQLEGVKRWSGKGEIFNIFIGNNIGYYGPHETTLRSRLQSGHLRGRHRVGRHREGLPLATDRAVRRRQRARHAARTNLDGVGQDPLHARPHHRRDVGLLQDLLLRRRVPRRLLVDGALHAGQARQHAILLPPRQDAREAGHPRAPREARRRA
jgi:organic radical activating enzyme